MKRPQNFDELLNIAKNRPDVHGALSQLGISLKRVGHSMGGVRWQTETKSGTSGDLSAVAFIEKSDGSWIIFDNKGRIGQQSMDAITCLREIFGVSFDDAVYMLSGGAPSAPIAKPQKLTLERKTEPQEKPTYTPPTPAPDKLRNVKAYLIQTRKLPKELVLPLIESGRIYSTYYENPETHKQTLVCGFKITDENGNDVGCDSCSPQPQIKFKHLFTGSNADYAWCFPYEIEEITAETPIFFCEAPIDTMSLCALSGTPGIYVSMAGCKDRTFTSVAEKLGGKPIICVDNDEAGDKFAARHPDVTRMVAPYGKDWNDTLKYYVENNLSYAYSAPDAETAPDVPLEDNVGGHVVHLDNEVIDPKKENGALDKGASGENEYLKAVSELETISDEAYLKARSDDPFILVSEHTPSVILNTFENGKDRQILIRRDALYLALRESGVQEGNYHGLGKETLLNLPKYLEDPDVILSTEKNNKERRLLLTSIPSKNGQGIISIEFETTKEFKGQNKPFNLIVTMFDLHQNYLKGQFKKFNAQIRYKKENLAQVNPQLLEWLRTFNARSSINSIPENAEKVNTSDEKNSNPLYDKDPPIADNVGKHSQDELRATLEAKADPDVPIDNNVGGHVIHLDNEVIDPQKENGALGKGASEENYLAETTDGRLVAVINTDILNGIDTSTWNRETEEAVKKAASKELKKFDKGIAVNGLTVTINKTSRREFTRSNYTNALYRRSPEDFSNKMRAATSIDNILISTQSLNSDGGLKKSRSDDFVDFHRGKVLLCIKEAKYEAEVLIGETKKGDFIFYDLLEIHSSTFVLKVNEKEKILPTVTPQNTFDDIPKDLSIDIIPENAEKVNTSDEKNSNPLYDKDPPIADNVGKQSQDELRATLEAKVKDVVENYRTDPRALAEYVIFCSRFNNYSAKNLCLIWSQNPNAQFVTSAYDFSHGLPDKDGKPTISEKIFIKKGEHALRIWKPYDVKYTVMPDGTEKRSAWLTKSERELAKAEKWKELKRTFFTLVPVFDITQTTASPDVYPKICGLGGIADATSEKIFKGISDYCKYELNCPVIVRDFGERKATVRGLYYPERNEIHISDMLEGENKRSTTLHEAGHAILRLYNYLNQNDSVALSELKADMIAIMLESAVGIKPTDARCEHLKAHYDKYLAERNVSDISAEDEVFNDVIKICREQMPTIIEYINNSMLTQAQSTEQTETQRNDTHITPKRTV